MCLLNSFEKHTLIIIIVLLECYDFYLQAEWKPESPERFGDISELIKSVESLKLGEGKSQGRKFLVQMLETVSNYEIFLLTYHVLNQFLLIYLRTRISSEENYCPQSYCTETGRISTSAC